MERLELEKQLREKYSNKRFTIKELNESLNFHFDLKGSKKFKLKKSERCLKELDYNLIFSVSLEENIIYDITVYYLKTNAKGYIYITEFCIELYDF